MCTAELFPERGTVEAELAGEGKQIVVFGIVPVLPRIGTVGCGGCCCSLLYSFINTSLLVFVAGS